jgi:hypothetical protein
MTTARGGKNRPLPENYKTRDHLTPIFRKSTKSMSDIVYCCNRCNREKGCLTFDEFRAVVAYRKNKVIVLPGKIFAKDKPFWKISVDIAAVCVVLLTIKRGLNL